LKEDIDAKAAQSYVDSQDALKAPLADPVFTGDPKAPTPATADNDTSIATTAFVKAQGYGAAVPPATVAPLMDGAAAVGSVAKYAKEDHIHPTDTSRAASTHTHAQGDVTNLVSDLALKAPLASPTFTGDPKSVTPATADNDTSIATTAYVQAQGYALASSIQPIATSAEYLANTANKTLDTDGVWGAAPPVTLTDGATVTPDFNLGINFKWTLGAVGRTLATNIKVGQSGVIFLVQDGTGSRTITTWGSYYKFPGGTKPTLTTAANAIDAIAYTVYSATVIVCSALADVK
jgi:hypothetical protein